LGVPFQETQLKKNYVWFDALNIYQSGVGFGWDAQKYNKCGRQTFMFIGKGIANSTQSTGLLFLCPPGLSCPRPLFIHGYFTVNGQKMSKTIGNVIDPIELINKYVN